MTPRQLESENFRTYPPQAQQIAVANLAILRRLPLAFLPLLLQELIVYDWKFPAEKDEVDRQLRYFKGLSADQTVTGMILFANLGLPHDLESMDWAVEPGSFAERLSVYLWASHQMDAFRMACETYIQAFNAAIPEQDVPTPRLGIVVIGKGIVRTGYPRFRKLRPHGMYFSQINLESNSKPMLEVLATRAHAYPLPYAHWSIDGAKPTGSLHKGVTEIAYDSLASVRNATIRKMQQIAGTNSGVEAIHRGLMATTPSDVGLGSPGSDPVLDRLAISLFTEGSGTQIYGTTFVQWTAREVLRRARPLTLLATFTPRQTEEAADEELSGLSRGSVLDPTGSLIDADMGAYYTWLNMQRLTGANQSAFLAWFEDSGEAVAIAPSMTAGGEFHGETDIASVLSQVTSTT
jgi:hypothetical protein